MSDDTFELSELNYSEPETTVFMGVLGRYLVLAVLLVIVLSSVKGTYEASQVAMSSRFHRVRDTRSDNITTEDSGGSEGGERAVDWLGRHWYIFVVFLVVVIVVFVFVCACFVQRSRLGTYHLQIHQNGNRYNPQINSSSHPVFTGRSSHPTHYSPRHSSIPTEDVCSSVTQHTQTSFLDTSNSTGVMGGVSVDATPTAPPIVRANESPWSFIQSIAKSRERRGSVREGERGRGWREGQSSSYSDKFKTSNPHHHHHHSHYHNHSPSYLHRWYRHSQRGRFSNPLTKMNGTPDESGTSLCSIPSTSGSMQSDPSNHSSNKSNRSRSNPSSCSRSDNSTVVEVNVNVRLSPKRLDRAKAVAMAALAESARQLAESAANLGGCEEVHSRSLPHSPYSPPRNSKRHTRHSVTGAPLTPPSLPPSSHLDRHHLLHSYSSSHLPPRHGSFEVSSSQPASPLAHHTISLDRKNMRHYYPVTHTAGGCYGTEDRGTVVSLDHNSSSSSCHGHSMVAYDPGQRSNLTQSPLGKKEATVVSLDLYSNGGTGDSDADVTVVSLDRADRSSDHRTRNYPQKTLTTHLQESSGCDEIGHSPAVSHSTFNSSRSHKPPPHVRHEYQSRHAQHMMTLNLDSQIEDTPVIEQPSGNLHHTRAKSNTRDDQNALNGYLCRSHVPHDTFSHLLSSNPSSPKLTTLHQQLHNISEQGESECFHSSDHFELGEEAIAQHSEHRHSVHVGSSPCWSAEPDFQVQDTRVDMKNLDRVDDSVAVRRRVKRGRRKRRRERQGRHRETGAAVIPDRDYKDFSSNIGGEATDGEKMAHLGNSAAQTANGLSRPSPDSLTDCSLQALDSRNHSTSPPQQQHSHSVPSPLSDPLSSSSLDKTHSPPQSGSAVSVSESLSSTASGYAATGESGSTCEVEVDSSGNKCVPEFEDIRKALLEARSQFSYPLQRLLDQDYKMESTGLDDELPFGSTSHPLSHFQPTQSHAGSESDPFQTHSKPPSSRVQQTQSVDV